MVLINVVEVGAMQEPNHLFLADVGQGRLTELLVEGEGFFAPWWAWAPDGRQLAYLAPARRGGDYELWLARADVRAPSARTPLLSLNLNVRAADWHPGRNFIGLTLAGVAGRPGLYILNADTDYLVLLAQDRPAADGLLDWSGEGDWMAYTDEDEALKMINAETAAIVELWGEGPARYLPRASTGWLDADRWYVFRAGPAGSPTAISTDGRGRLQELPADFALDPEALRLSPGGKWIFSLEESQILAYDLAGQESLNFTPPPGLIFSPSYFAGGDFANEQGVLFINAYLRLGEADFAECLIFDPQSGEFQFMREALNQAAWGHSWCQLLEGGGHVAVMGTNRLEPVDQLSDDLAYDLWIVGADLRRQSFITGDYAGFALSELGFSARQALVIFPQGEALMVYNMAGEGRELVKIRDLNLEGRPLRFSYDWQP
jgi:hypothetical protein